MSLPSFQLRALWISITSDLKVWGIQSVFQRFLHCILRSPNPLHFQTWQISWEGNSHAFEPGHTPQEEPCLLCYCKTTGDFSILDWGSLTSHSAPKFSIGAVGKNNCAFRAPKFPNCCQPLKTSKYLLVPLSVSEFLYMGQDQSLAHTQNWKNNPREENSDNSLFTSEELYPLQIFSLFKLFCLHSFLMSFKIFSPTYVPFVIVAEMVFCHDLLHPS